MIWVTRLNGSEVVLNADLIETVESTPDTVVTLVDGKKYVVTERAAEVITRVRSFRASILTLADQPLPMAPDEPPSVRAGTLYMLPVDGEEG